VRPSAFTSLVLLAALLSGCSRREPIVIGLAGPFDDPIGAPMLRAARLAVNEINASGGINGRPIQLLERNDHGHADSAVVAATELYRSRAVAVLGHLYSGQTLAAAPVYNGGANPIVELSPSSSAPEVSAAGPYTFRLCPSDDAHGAALARWVRQRLAVSQGSVLYLNDDYGRGIRQTFEREFERLGGRIIYSDPYLPDPVDVDAYLDRMRADGRSEFLLVAGNGPEARVIVLGLRARGLDIPVLGGDGLEGVEEAGAAAEGVFYTAAYVPGDSSAANRRFVEAYQRALGGVGLPNQPAAATYDAVYLLRDVIARAGANRKAIRAALADVGVRTRPFEGVTGTLRFDTNGDAPDGLVTIGIVRNGRLRRASGG